ncbi:MAG: 5-(carboxyamino)imidazole ribonucleotide synthase [Undibacterium sp.]|nr:5-(carboxyamino)imidazole ribonucleotide synthase [Undibacterium sp.]
MTHDLPATSPNAHWLGILGGGQLGKMFIQAAHTLNYKVALLAPEQDCPASAIADRHIVADYLDAEALSELSNLTDYITTEFENVPVEALEILAKSCTTAPSAACVAIAQNRILEKNFINQLGQKTQVYTAPFHLIQNTFDLENVEEKLFPAILKRATQGYDGKGQISVRTALELANAWQELDLSPSVLEKKLDLDFEVSIVLARASNGQTQLYPLSENVHREGILIMATVPCQRGSQELHEKIQKTAFAIAHELNYIGVLCVEFFVLTDGTLVVNEIAPRPHNSGHYTLEQGYPSQFEQQVRALIGQDLAPLAPIVPIEPIKHSVMLNLLGDLWFQHDPELAQEPDWDAICALAGAHLHLYGKKEARRKRKMGHITFTGNERQTVLDNAARACAMLGIEI